MAIFLSTPEITATAAKRRAAWVKWPWEERQPRPHAPLLPPSPLELELQELDAVLKEGIELLWTHGRRWPNRSNSGNAARTRGRPRGLSWDRERRKVAGMALLQNAAAAFSCNLKNIGQELRDAGFESGLGAAPPAAVAAGIKILSWRSISTLEKSLVLSNILPSDWY